jgi:hypothetical protein
MKKFNAFRAWFTGRFPRLAYYYGSPSAWNATVQLYAGGMLFHLAEQRVISHGLALPAMIWCLAGFYSVWSEAWHAVTCPCVVESLTPVDLLDAEADGGAQ